MTNRPTSQPDNTPNPIQNPKIDQTKVPPVSDLQKIPGIGANLEHHLHNIGIRCIADLVGKNPEDLYHLDCLKKGFQDDRCVLYVFRCAVYFAEHKQHEPEKLKWWYWKDKEYPEV